MDILWQCSVENSSTDTDNSAVPKRHRHSCFWLGRPVDVMKRLTLKRHHYVIKSMHFWRTKDTTSGRRGRWGLRRRIGCQDYVPMLTNKLYIDNNSTVKKGLRRLCSVIVAGHCIRWSKIVERIPSDNDLLEFIYKIHIHIHCTGDNIRNEYECVK